MKIVTMNIVRYKAEHTHSEKKGNNCYDYEFEIPDFNVSAVVLEQWEQSRSFIVKAKKKKQL